MRATSDYQGMFARQHAHDQTTAAFALDERERRRVIGDSPSSDKLATVREIVALLGARLPSRKLAELVRIPAAAYDGRTMLDLIADDEHERLLALVTKSFGDATSH